MAIDLTLLTPEQVDKFIHIQSIVAGQQEAAAIVNTLRDYYDGFHPIYLSDRQKEYLEPALKQRKSGGETGDVRASLTEGDFTFSQNTVRSIVDTLRERLSVSGFAVNGAAIDSEGDDTPEKQIAALMWAWWEENRLDAQQIRNHRRAIRDGKSYVMVDYDNVNKRPRFTLHQVDDGRTGITCHRDPENPDIILFMNKHWYTYDPLKAGETGDRRKNTYLPHEIRKYIMGKAGWLRMDGVEAPFDEGDSEWPIPWLDWEGKPLGVTLKEFENPGGSEVAQIIGLQNALNKSWLDLLAAADAAGFPVLVIEYESTGAFPVAEDDEDIEDDDEFIMAPGRALEIDGGRAHRLEIANLTQLIDTIHLIVETISGISRTPQYYLRPVGGDVPSGEALKQLESGLVSRAIERQLIFGQAWADVMVMAYKVARTFGPPIPEVPKLKVQTSWASAETRQELTDAQRGEILKRLGIPDDEIFAMLGYSSSQIAKWKATQRSDTAANTAAVVSAIQKAQATQPQVTNVVNNNGNGTQGVPAVNGNGAR